MGSTRNANRRRRMILLTPTVSHEEACALLPEEDPRANNTLNKAVDKFRQACEAVGPIQIRVTGPEIEEPLFFSFPTSFVVIGRSRRADLRLNHPDVSLRHSYLQLIGGCLYCVDLQSRTGTAHESESSGGELLEVDEGLRIGPYHLQVIYGRNSEEGPSVEIGSSFLFDEFATDEMVRADVEILNSKGKVRRFRPVEEAITLVGNAPGSHLRLKDNSISKTHCALVRTADALWCVDLLGRGGTRLNGAEIRIGRLHESDLLHVGKAKIRIHYSAGDEQTQPPATQPPATQPPAMEQPTIPQRETPAVETPPPSTPDDLTASSVTAAAAAVPPLDQLIPQQLMGNLPVPPLPVPAAGVQLPQTTGPRSDSERNVSEAFVMSLVNQFGQMQQQMYQQSQQAMMMLVNMFSSLHQNHMELIRDDLNRVHEITAELQAVQTQMLAGQSSATNVDFTRDTPAETVAEQIPEAVISQPPPEQEAAASTKAPPKPSVKQAPPPAKTMGQTSTVGETEQPTRQRADYAGVRTHALLSERLAELETERNSRWQKIMKTLKGIGGGV